MEDALWARVVGQDHIVSATSDAVRISRARLQAPTRPVASFLFMGPTRVGEVCAGCCFQRRLLTEKFLDRFVQGARWVLVQ